jgi:hypothetical protein
MSDKNEEDSSFWAENKIYFWAFVFIILIIIFTNKSCAPVTDLDDGYNQKMEYKLQNTDFGKLLQELDNKKL